jgi:hypothetical protein
MKDEFILSKKWRHLMVSSIRIRRNILLHAPACMWLKNSSLHNISQYNCTAGYDLFMKMNGLENSSGYWNSTTKANYITVTPPSGINYDRRWLLWCGGIIHEGFELFKEISEIFLVEVFKRPEKKEE